MKNFRFSSAFLTEALIQNILEQTAKADSSDIYFDRIWTDSRTITPNDFFVALEGEHFDGHNFIPDMIKKGVRGFLIHNDYPGNFPDGTFVIKLEDTLEGFRQIAAAWRSQFSIPIIAVAGSVGKTTVKELLASFLSSKFKVSRTEKSQNGFIGIPMTILSWELDIEVAVVEVGIDDIGAMSEHLYVVRPTHGIITALGPEHLNKLQNTETAAEEELQIFSFLEMAEGKIFWNLDEELLEEKKRPSGALTFSLKKSEADYFGEIEDANIIINAKDKKIKVPLFLPGSHNARNLIGVVAIADSFGISENEMISGIKRFKNPENRLNVKNIPGDIQVISDVYNANPTSMEAAFEVLKNNFKNSFKIIVLGDMLEFGSLEETYHRELAKSIESLKPKYVLLFGKRMAWLEDELKKRGSAFQVEHFKDKQEISRKLSSITGKGDVILIKGSRGMKMEGITCRRAVNSF